MPFQKGQSGNPGGRPARLTSRDVFRSKLRAPHPKQLDRTRLEVWVDLMLDEAESAGNGEKMEILRWLDGANPPQTKGPDPDDLDTAESTDEHGNALTS